MKKIIYLLIIVVFVACHSTKNVSDTSKNTTTTENIYRFSVSFISIGAGVDLKAIPDYDQYISQYEKKNNLKLSFEKSDWGLEGEVDYCFKLSELDKKKQELFIQESKEILKNSELVRYKENTTCQQKRKF